MTWKDILKNSASGLALYLAKEIQYKNMSKKSIRQIAQREIEQFIQNYKRWTQKDIILSENSAISRTDQNQINKFLKKRKQGIPLAYVIGQQEFYGLTFKLNKNTLIPRPETEELVENVLNLIFRRLLKRKRPFLLIDVGTGSGCILVSLVKHSLAHFANFTAHGIDKSQEALKIAEFNAKKLLGTNIKISFIQSSQFDFLNKMKIDKNKPLLIIANLPYLSEKEYASLSREVKKEPREALIGGKNGHEIIIKFLEKLSKTKFNAEVFLEISPTIFPLLQKYCATNKKISHFKFSRDSNKKIRFLKAKIVFRK